MLDQSFIALDRNSFCKKDLNAKPRQKSVNRKNRSRFKTERRVDLYPSGCMHDLSFMALALKVSEKMTLTPKLNKSQ